MLTYLVTFDVIREKALKSMSLVFNEFSKITYISIFKGYSDPSAVGVVCWI